MATEVPSNLAAQRRRDNAERALAEAEERRRVAQAARPKEIAGRGGEEPTRYGDWEVKGIACDF